jgi:hypothetical protein
MIEDWEAIAVRREGRTAELPLVGSRHELDPHSN